MNAPSHTQLTPQQVAAVEAGNGFAHAENPTTHRIYLLVEQGQAPTLSDDYFRQKIAEGLADVARNECQPWDIDAMKAEFRLRYADRSTQSQHAQGDPHTGGRARPSVDHRQDRRRQL